MGSKSNQTNSTTQILGFILILFLILFLYKYYTTNFSYLYKDNQVPNAPEQDIRIRCPPKHTIILPTKHEDNNDLDDKSILMHENDLNIVDSKFNLYDDRIVDNHGFENELGNNTDIDKSLSVELDSVFIETSLNNNNNNDDNKYAHSCSHSKPQKSDLPLANVPYFLLQEDKPLRLSEKFM
jgi:hypothetical protein